MNGIFIPARAAHWMIAFLLLLLAGCATSKIDWAGRVGTFTRDQAVLELGPPDKQATLADGTVVAEWLMHRGHVQVYSAFAYGGSYRYGGAIYPGYLDSYSPDYYLRLIFAPDGKLKAWKRFAK